MSLIYTKETSLTWVARDRIIHSPWNNDQPKDRKYPPRIVSVIKLIALLLLLWPWRVVGEMGIASSDDEEEGRDTIALLLLLLLLLLLVLFNRRRLAARCILLLFVAALPLLLLLLSAAISRDFIV